MDIDKLHEKFMSGEKLSVIAEQLRVSESVVNNHIRLQRNLNPDKWPKRIRREVEVRLFHVYECEKCKVTFAVEQAYENQDEVCCNICWTDRHVIDVDSGEMRIKK